MTRSRHRRTFGSIMVGVAETNEKLRARIRRIVCSATGAALERVEDAPEAAGGEATLAIVTLIGIDAADARDLLESSDGSVRRAVER